MRLPSYQDLSKEQDRINDLPADGRHLVIGPPGTGKTVMALYRAAMLKKQKRRSMLLMYSRLLMQYTESAAEELLLDGQVSTFHKWFPDYYWANYRELAPQIEPYHFDFAAILPKVNSNPPRPSSMTDLIVDEGQDLPKEFYLLTPLIAPNVTVFADENQRITETCSSIEEIKAFGAFVEAKTLTRNYRNTSEIARLAGEFYVGLASGIPLPPERRGEMPTVRAFESAAAFVEHLRRYESNNPDKSIGVVVPTRPVQNRILRLIGDATENPVQTYFGGQGSKAPKVLFDQPGIVVLNYKSAKGLEFDTVFVPELQEVQGDLSLPDVRMKFYVLFSRARDELHLSYSGRGEPPIMKVIPAQLVEWL
jgi:superfamily I DNA/RNA helicase